MQNLLCYLSRFWKIVLFYAISIASLDFSYCSYCSVDRFGITLADHIPYHMFYMQSFLFFSELVEKKAKCAIFLNKKGKSAHKFNVRALDAKQIINFFWPK